MLGSIFETLNEIATFIGWATMIWAVIWLISKRSEEIKASEDAKTDRKAKYEFESALKIDNPDKFRRYQNIKEKYRIRGETVSWTQVASEAGVSF